MRALHARPSVLSMTDSRRLSPRRRSFASILTAGALAFCLSGCREVPLAQGPTYRLPDIVEAGRVIPAGGGERTLISLDFRDQRPAWEKRFHRAAQQPAGWKRAIGFVPLENIQPALKQQIIDSVQQACDRMPETPTWGIIHLESFRIVVNDTEARHREYLEQQRELELEMERERHMSWMMNAGSNSGVGVGIGFTSSPFEPHPALRPPHAPYSDADAWFVPDSEIVGGRKMLIGPPKELPDTYGSGVTCEMTSRIELFWAGGKSREFHFTAAGYILAPSSDFYDITGDIPKAVQNALDDLRETLVREANGSGDLSDKQSGSQSPRFIESSLPSAR